MASMKQIKVTAVVTQDVKDDVQKLAERERRSEGDIVRLALEQYLSTALNNHPPIATAAA